MSRRAALAIALGALLVPGCDERPVLEWGVALPDGVEADAWVVESRAGCAPGDAVFERWRVTPGGAEERRASDERRVALRVIALDGSCRRVAEGCSLLSPEGRVEVALVETAPDAACPGEDWCEVAGCEAAPDAGADAGEGDAGPALDGGADAGPPDAGTGDAGGDAGPGDAGPEDAGPPDAGPPPFCDGVGDVYDCEDFETEPSRTLTLGPSASYARVEGFMGNPGWAARLATRTGDDATFELSYPARGEGDTVWFRWRVFVEELPPSEGPMQMYAWSSADSSLGFATGATALGAYYQWIGPSDAYMQTVEGRFPTGRWVCVEQRVDVGVSGRSEVFVDGESWLAQDADTLGPGPLTNAKVGLSAYSIGGTWERDAVVHLDDVVISATRVPCP